MTWPEHGERADPAGREPARQPVTQPATVPPTQAGTGKDAPHLPGDPNQGRARRGHGRTDLRAHSFPLLAPDQWQHPGDALRQMYLDAEKRAIEAYDWYLADRLRKRTWSRILRAMAIILAAAGGLQPLISAASSRMSFGWGYVLLASAAICVAFDHFFGISTRWMRDVVTAQKLRHRLQEFQLDWAAMDAHDALTTTADGADGTEVQKYLGLLRDFVADVSGIMMAETAEWVAEFQTGISQLSHQTVRQ